MNREISHLSNVPRWYQNGFVGTQSSSGGIYPAELWYASPKRSLDNEKLVRGSGMELSSAGESLFFHSLLECTLFDLVWRIYMAYVSAAQLFHSHAYKQKQANI